jgi:hypothetical protein
MPNKKAPDRSGAFFESLHFRFRMSDCARPNALRSRRCGEPQMRNCTSGNPEALSNLDRIGLRCKPSGMTDNSPLSIGSDRS